METGWEPESPLPRRTQIQSQPDSGSGRGESPHEPRRVPRVDTHHRGPSGPRALRGWDSGPTAQVSESERRPRPEHKPGCWVGRGMAVRVGTPRPRTHPLRCGPWNVRCAGRERERGRWGLHGRAGAGRGRGGRGPRLQDAAERRGHWLNGLSSGGTRQRGQVHGKLRAGRNVVLARLAELAVKNSN